MKRVLFGVSLISLLACACEGKKGDTGPAGPIGPSSTDMLIGSVSSNQFTVTDSRISDAQVVTVYLNASSEVAELPYYLPASGVNTYAIIKPLTDQIEIFNGVLAGGTQYIISLTF